MISNDLTNGFIVTILSTVSLHSLRLDWFFFPHLFFLHNICGSMLYFFPLRDHVTTQSHVSPSPITYVLFYLLLGWKA
ncbi:hypothetical protein P280DRAFT_268429 [Massarina eburnea CBS 473.64]|uniref:Uncharacterized protein n=1 Tax=Massarina eburnea CBS 473.64 TaxID=1395130 RepID=A0A6A6S8Q5_9PLEO|nr:hypothetical protein P280DRAFT_268429 [Massarina eburnea CBS 473.64]